MLPGHRCLLRLSRKGRCNYTVLLACGIFLLVIVLPVSRLTNISLSRTRTNKGVNTATRFFEYETTANNCQALIEGHVNSRLKTRRIDFQSRVILTEQELLKATRNCNTFKKERQYPTRPKSVEEANFPIAFTIVMHKDPGQVERLLRAIYQPQNLYCIHIDARSREIIQKAMRTLALCFPNVLIASKLESIVYAGFGRLQADVTCMKDLAGLPIDWKYLINLSGQMFPLKTNEELVKILKIYNGANDIEAVPQNRSFPERWKFVYKRKVRSSGSILRTDTQKDPPPHGLVMVKGSAYGVFSRAFVDFVLTDQKAKDLLEWSKDAYSPDEHYWSTLNHLYYNEHLRTPGGYSGKPAEKPWLATYVSWKDEAECHGMHIRRVCIFGVGDLQELVKRPELFLNKVYARFQPPTIDCLDWWLHNKITPQIDEHFYESLPFVIK